MFLSQKNQTFDSIVMLTNLIQPFHIAPHKYIGLEMINLRVKIKIES